MKVFAISDLHLSLTCDKPMKIFGPVWEGHFEKICEDWKNKVTNEDVVLIAGDVSWAMKLEEAVLDLNEIAKLPGTIIITRGNHDYWWKSLQSIRSVLKDNMRVIQNDSIKIGDYIFCGTRGWTVSENNKYVGDDERIFKREIIRMELALKSAKQLQINNEKIIYMIHYPPFNSKLEKSEFVKLFEEYGVSKVIYGHLHGSTGRIVKWVDIDGIEYYLTSCDQVDNQLVEIF